MGVFSVLNPVYTNLPKLRKKRPVKARTYLGAPTYCVTQDIRYEIRMARDISFSPVVVETFHLTDLGMVKLRVKVLKKLPETLTVTVVRTNVVPTYDVLIVGWTRVWGNKVYERWRRF